MQFLHFPPLSEEGATGQEQFPCVGFVPPNRPRIPPSGFWLPLCTLGWAFGCQAQAQPFGVHHPTGRDLGMELWGE